MRKPLLLLILALVIAASGGYATYALRRTVAPLQPVVNFHFAQAAAPVSLSWPAYGSGAIGAVGYGILETHGSDKPLPTASTIKVLTALVVLNQKPLLPGEPGPTITITPADVASYNKYVSKDGSVVRVNAGEKLTEYQALQAMLIPSANNMAETLARWTFGSTDAFNRAANAYAITLGMNHTTVTDPSGFLSTTISSPTDLLRLGMVAINNPVIAKIVSQKSANLPVQGTVHNYNSLIGGHGIVGIKTGNNDEDLGSLLFAAKRTIDGSAVTIVGIVMGGPSLPAVLRDTTPLLESTARGFALVTVATSDTSAAVYQAPWDGNVAAHPTASAHMLIWKDSVTAATVDATPVAAPIVAHAAVGQLVIHNSKHEADANIPLVLAGSIQPPTIFWRLTHPR